MGEFTGNNPLLLTAKGRERWSYTFPSLRESPFRGSLFCLLSPSPPHHRSNEKASENGACFVSGSGDIDGLGLQFKGGKMPKHPRKNLIPLLHAIYGHAFFFFVHPCKNRALRFLKTGRRSRAELTRGGLPRVLRRTVTRSFEGGTHCCTLIGEPRARPAENRSWMNPRATDSTLWKLLFDNTRTIDVPRNVSLLLLIFLEIPVTSTGNGM